MKVTMCILLVKTPSGTMKLHPEAQLRSEIRDAYIPVCGPSSHHLSNKNRCEMNFLHFGIWNSCMLHLSVDPVCGIELYKMESQFFLENWHIAIAPPPSLFTSQKTKYNTNMKAGCDKSTTLQGFLKRMQVPGIQNGLADSRIAINNMITVLPLTSCRWTVSITAISGS